MSRQYVYEYELRQGGAVTSTGQMTLDEPTEEGSVIGVASSQARVERITLGPPGTDGRLILRLVS